MGPQIDPESQVTLASVHRGPLFYLLWGPNVRSVLARSGLTMCASPRPAPPAAPGTHPGEVSPVWASALKQSAQSGSIWKLDLVLLKTGPSGSRVEARRHLGGRTSRQETWVAWVRQGGASRVGPCV